MDTRSPQVLTDEQQKIVDDARANMWTTKIRTFVEKTPAWMFAVGGLVSLYFVMRKDGRRR